MSPARGDEEGCRERVIRFRVAEEGGAGEAEEDEVDGDHVAEDFVVSAGEGDGGGEYGLQQDGGGGDLRAFVEGADGLEENAVAGHGVVDSRRGEHALAEEAECGEGDGGGDGASAGGSEGEAHDRAGWGGCVGQAIRA